MPVFFSLFLHASVFYAFTPKITSRGLPVIYAWPRLLLTQDLFQGRNLFHIPDWVNIEVNRFYFFDKDYVRLSEQTAVFREEISKRTKPSLDYVSLWDEREKIIYPSLVRNERREYKIYLSDKGKPLIVFSTSLPVGSHFGASHREYLRQAVISWQDRFFWTSAEYLIK